MSKRANGLQRMAEKVSDGPLGGCGEGFTATEFSAAVRPTASRGGGVHARDRALAGLISINLIKLLKSIK